MVPCLSKCVNHKRYWRRDNRGTMLRVIGGEPATYPYLTMAAQIHAGLDGLRRGLRIALRRRP